MRPHESAQAMVPSELPANGQHQPPDTCLTILDDQPSQDLRCLQPQPLSDCNCRRVVKWETPTSQSMEFISDNTKDLFPASMWAGQGCLTFLLINFFWCSNRWPKYYLFHSSIPRTRPGGLVAQGRWNKLKATKTPEGMARKLGWKEKAIDIRFQRNDKVIGYKRKVVKKQIF